MSNKKIWWDIILKVVIAIASALLGVMGVSSMTL